MQEGAGSSFSVGRRLSCRTARDLPPSCPAAGPDGCCPVVLSRIQCPPKHEGRFPTKHLILQVVHREQLHCRLAPGALMNRVMGRAGACPSTYASSTSRRLVHAPAFSLHSRVLPACLLIAACSTVGSIVSQSALRQDQPARAEQRATPSHSTCRRRDHALSEQNCNIVFTMSMSGLPRHGHVSLQWTNASCLPPPPPSKAGSRRRRRRLLGAALLVICALP